MMPFQLTKVQSQHQTDESNAAAVDDAPACSAFNDAASTVPPETDPYEADSADEGPVAVSSNDGDTPTETDIHEAGPDESTAMDSDADSSTSSRISQRKPVKRMKRFFGRLFRAMCCCCCSAAAHQ